jgi:hypothetical protein
MPFYDSEPMSILFPTKDGPPKTILDMARFLHETTGRPANIVTSGWNPRSVPAEASAAAMAADMAADQAPYLHRIDGYGSRLAFQIKAVSKRFRDEAKAFITPVLRSDPGFQRMFGKEFERFAFDFKSYPDGKGESAYRMYRDIVAGNLKAFVDFSQYLADRMENLKTLAPAIRAGKVQLNYYALDFGGLSAEEYSPDAAFVAPWLSQDNAGFFMGYLKGRFHRTYGRDLIPDWDRGWDFRWWELRRLPGPASRLGTPILLHNGTIEFSGASVDSLASRLPNMAASERSDVVRRLADTPVFALDGRKAPWQAAADRLDGTRHLDLTEAVRQSVAERIRQASEGSLSPRLRDVSRRAVLRSVQGKRPEAWLKIREGVRVYWFRFKDGRLYEKTDPPSPAIMPQSLPEEVQGRNRRQA